MSPMDAVWHLLNFVTPPLAVAALLVTFSKGWAWRRQLAGSSWSTLWAQSALGGLAGQLGTLLALGVEGKLVGYAVWLTLLSLPIGWRLIR